MNGHCVDTPSLALQAPASRNACADMKFLAYDPAQPVGALSWDLKSQDTSNKILHSTVKVVSLIFYVPAFGVFLLGYRKASAGRWRYALLLGMAGTLLMSFWSLILSGQVSFDEVWPAWLLASLLFAVLSVMGLRRERNGLRGQQS